MFSIFKRKKVAGDIASLGLQDWWFSIFTEEDRPWMADTYSPGGGGSRPLVEGGGLGNINQAFYHLSMVSTWFNKEGHQHCAIAFAEKAMEFYSDDLAVLDRHFGLQAQCTVYYRWRDEEKGALEKAIAACERSISFHREAARALVDELGAVPAHACFKQLRIIEEKRGNLERAIALCETAKEGGWSGSWDKDIARLEKKAAARKSRA